MKIPSKMIDLKEILDTIQALNTKIQELETKVLALESAQTPSAQQPQE